MDKTIEKSQAAKQRKFCEAIKTVPWSTIIYKLLAKGKTNGVPALPKPDGSYTNNKCETLEVLL